MPVASVKDARPALLSVALWLRGAWAEVQNQACWSWSTTHTIKLPAWLTGCSWPGVVLTMQRHMGNCFCVLLGPRELSS